MKRSILQRFTERLPARYQVALRTLGLWRLFPYRELLQLKTAHYCPICEHHPLAFLPYGVNPRPNALCPFCGSLERHRLVYLFMRQQTDLFLPPRKRMLHVAPEPCFVGIFGKEPTIEYITADVKATARVRTDLAALGFPDKSFDAILCAHVLEHVPDDRRAMRELYRVLKPGGWAILPVPINARVTSEIPGLDPVEHGLVFGVREHARIYGEDYYDRLREAQFVVQRETVEQQSSPAMVMQLGLSPIERVTFCVRSPK